MGKIELLGSTHSIVNLCQCVSLPVWEAKEEVEVEIHPGQQSFDRQCVSLPLSEAEEEAGEEEEGAEISLFSPHSKYQRISGSTFRNGRMHSRHSTHHYRHSTRPVSKREAARWQKMTWSSGRTGSDGERGSDGKRKVTQRCGLSA